MWSLSSLNKICSGKGDSVRKMWRLKAQKNVKALVKWWSVHIVFFSHFVNKQIQHFIYCQQSANEVNNNNCGSFIKLSHLWLWLITRSKLCFHGDQLQFSVLLVVYVSIIFKKNIIACYTYVRRQCILTTVLNYHN